MWNLYIIVRALTSSQKSIFLILWCVLCWLLRFFFPSCFFVCLFCYLDYFAFRWPSFSCVASSISTCPSTRDKFTEQKHKKRRKWKGYGCVDCEKGKSRKRHHRCTYTKQNRNKIVCTHIVHTSNSKNAICEYSKCTIDKMMLLLVLLLLLWVVNNIFVRRRKIGSH